MTLHSHRKLKFLSSGWLRLTVSVLLLALLLNQMDLHNSLEVLRTIQPKRLLIVVAFALFGRFFAAYRWYILLHGKNQAITFSGLTRLIFVSNLFGFFAPGSLGVDISRVYGLSRTTSDLALSF